MKQEAGMNQILVDMKNMSIQKSEKEKCSHWKKV